MALRSKDLMIGDWVRGFVPDSNSTIYGIFNEQRIAIIAEPSKAYIELSIDDIQPIPLTPEILEKNGFKKGIGFGYSETYPTYCWGYHNDVTDLASVEVTFYDKPIGAVKVLVRMETNSLHPCGFNTFHSCDLENVHELQHALRLCGIDKEIEL